MSPQAELDDLLSTDYQLILDFEQRGFDRLTAPFQHALVLFGAGNLGRLVRAKLRALGIEPLAFADNSRTLQGSDLEGVPVLSLEDAMARFNDRAAFVTTIWGAVPPSVSANRLQKHLRSQLAGLGCRRSASFPLLFCKYPAQFLPYYCIDLPHKVLQQAEEIRRAFALMDDELSRRVFVAQVRHRLRLDFDALPRAIEEEQYFCDSLFRFSEREVFVDCGAFDGDTLKMFLERRGHVFERYVAIEPDPINFAKLKASIAALPEAATARISAHELATGDRRCKVAIDPTGLPSSAVGQGSMEVDCVPLDELLGKTIPTTIKMDIEGAEYNTLKGARHTIAAHAPLLEVCVYHAQDHVWSIPLLIHSLNPDYRLYLRPHKDEVWDLVCYAVPPGRLVG
jgi:FkbM family methyltransferase